MFDNISYTLEKYYMNIYKYVIDININIKFSIYNTSIYLPDP